MAKITFHSIKSIFIQDYGWAVLIKQLKIGNEY